MQLRNISGRDSPNRISILAVIPQHADRGHLRAIVDHSNWTLFFTGSVAETMRVLGSNPAQVVLCERDLPDGTWKDLLDQLAMQDRPPSLVVTSRFADERLLAEALNLGCYDVLLQPFEPSELFRVLSLAWHSFNNRPTPLQHGRLALAAAG